MKKAWLAGLLVLVLSLPLSSHPKGNKHLVKKGETLYSVAKSHHLLVSALAKANNLSVKTKIRIGEYLIIPCTKTTETTAHAYKPVAVPSTPDTPYREEDIRTRATFIQQDNLKSSAEEKKEATETNEPVKIIDDLKTTSTDVTEYPEIFDNYSTKGYKIKRIKGEADYLSAGNQNLAFYNNAETGSVIRITNLMNQKTIFVKVTGKVPSADAAKDIVLKLNNKSAQDLFVSDKKFLVEVASYSSN